MRLRLATPADAPALAQILRAGLRDVLPHLPDLHTPAEDLVFLATQVLPRCTVWAAEAEGEVVGYIAYREGWISPAAGNERS